MVDETHKPLVQIAECASTLLALRPVFVNSLSPYSPLVLSALADTTELISAMAADLMTKVANKDDSESQANLLDEPTSLADVIHSLPAFLQTVIEQLRSDTSTEARTLCDWAVRSQTYAFFLREAAKATAKGAADE
jgi:hypothetical protein